MCSDWKADIQACHYFKKQHFKKFMKWATHKKREGKTNKKRNIRDI